MIYIYIYDCQQSKTTNIIKLKINNSNLVLLLLLPGPGCSSVGYGAAQELGPFIVQKKDRLALNKFSLNKGKLIKFQFHIMFWTLFIYLT